MAAILKIENLKAAYGGIHALRGVSLEVEEGEIVSVLGANGAGKSTLLKCISAVMKRTDGTIEFMGKPISNKPHEIVESGLVQVPEARQIFAKLTVAENLRMGKPDATDAELWDALELAQIADFLREKPEGLDFKLEQAATNVSGGQKQRIAIARAILKDAPIYLFDDSFSALDFLTEARVRKALNQKLAGRTRIVITQRVVSAMHCDRIFVLSDGALVGAGTHAELLTTCPIYREIYLSQTGGGAL